MGAVFASINAGSASGSATQAFGLKKVDKSQMTHKNAALREQPGLAPKEKAPKASESKTKAAAAAAPVGPPRLGLDKGTWFVENYRDGKEELVIPEVQMKQNVYISKCKNMTIQIPDKCKSIQVDKCEKVRVVFKAVVSTFEVVNSQRIYASCLEMCPSFALDKSSGVSVIVSRAALNQLPAPPEIVASNISECNLVVPGPTDDVDPTEIPIPEQFITKYDLKKKKISTEPVTHGG
jgi:adenylyl cyclase-associated protein